MKILRNAGTHRILAIMCPIGAGDPLTLIEQAGRTAYQSQNRITSGSSEKFVRMLIQRKHESVLEHSAMTVLFDKVSRGFTHEMVRHRLCAFTQESTRYVDESEFEVVTPPHQKENIKYSESLYKELRRKEWACQDARQVLPIAIKSQIVCTTNFREWRHIFKIRTAKNAHWEIRRVMIQLLADVQNQIPIVFDDIVPEFTFKEATDWDWVGKEWFNFHAETWQENREKSNQEE